MNSFKKLSHSIYEFKYHTVFCPKHLYRIFEDQIGQYAKQEVILLIKQRELVEAVHKKRIDGPPNSFHRSSGNQ